MTLTLEQSPDAVWRRCLKVIKARVNGQSYKTWFEPISVAGLKTDGEAVSLTVQLPSRFYYEWLEEHYRGLLHTTVSEVLGADSQIFYAFSEDEAPDEDAPFQPPAGDGAPGLSAPPLSSGPAVNRNGRHGAPSVTDTPVIDSGVNRNYSFNSYIEGDCNRLARSAALAISHQPGETSFNPFLVYGGVGLGKTHLIQAIGNQVLAQKRGKSVLYVSSERFTTDFVQSIQHNRISEFSAFYRQIDLLIVDDIQFFGGKEKTQEEFFHIFNTLHQSGKQIVLSADRPPKDIQGIEERLLSRFQWGLTADVQPPDLETRTAIAQRKAEEFGVEIPPEVVEFVTNNVENNVRELEGAIVRLLAHVSLRDAEITLPVAKEALRDMVKERRYTRTIDDIQQIVAEYFKMSVDLLRAKTRKREIVQARQISMYFCKQLTTHSLKKIGLHFGGRDHSTVIHAIEAVEGQIDVNPSFKSLMEEVRHKLDVKCL